MVDVDAFLTCRVTVANSHRVVLQRVAINREAIGRARFIHAGVDAPDLVVDGLEGPPIQLNQYGSTESAGVPLNVDGGERIE